MNADLASARPRLGRVAVVFLLTLTAALWGVTFVAGKVAGNEAGPLTVALWRFILAAAVLTPMAAWSPQGLGTSTLGPKGWLMVAVSSLTGLALYNFFFIKGLGLTTAGRASAIVAASPALIYLGAVLFLRERLTAIRLLGLACSTLGAIWVVTWGRPASLLEGDYGAGEALIACCVVVWAVYSLIGKSLTARVSALAANAWTCLGAVVMLLPMVAAAGEPLGAFMSFSPAVWLSVAFLGVGGTAVGFTCFYLGINVLGPHRAASYINLVPVFGVLAGWRLLGEIPDKSLTIGLAMILAGISLVQRR
jgi:drug/metabolite transporter (DMT)-like permease